ncbi:Mov34-domain-containing protein [Saitoella complicata NRRL Y-17804]|uniref:MPN domain-containing protein n=1 Tax=Saitoella complicata (strain BCRC 22490 / CBS 7301 / JCM 7358 / NBRC 10748 / NRRL Y-17804) TaxID=698492 RepID=A0A0E9NAV5_SAICN|nr:Mov34-domain-containing protein [Saitoella complicata NRRL Y-17804]ODQ56483.1 Mov34-domain-containing protein [Saitoella complicata NRRL Y-17804]GAO46540.1 hypothetical protein G7K_0770-t1 [Saitoella complicata NRRL Y-17804]
MSAPRSVKELADLAVEPVRFLPGTSLRVSLRTAESMWKQGNVYLLEGNDEQAYILLLRYAEFIIKTLPAHPEAKASAGNWKEIKAHHARVDTLLQIISGIKKRLEERYLQYQRMLLEDAEERRRQETERRVKLIQDNEVDNDTDEEEKPWLARSLRRGSAEGSHGKLDLVEEIRGLQLDRRRDDRSTRHSTRPSSDPKRRSGVSYPTVERTEKRSSFENNSNWTNHVPLPESPWLQKQVSSPPLIPLPPPKPTSRLIPPLPQTPPPSFPAPKKGQEAYEFSSSARTEGGDPLRTLFIPKELRDRFLEVAKPNTTRNLETCGILCGKLKQNALFVTHLVIPAQESTSDTCQTIDEGAIFEFQDARELLTLGWIHTHPTQTCFMSSVDLHTHCSYQLMLDEAVAIVCAPSRGEWGYFRLTKPPGMEVITKCRNTGLFHLHDDVPGGIYTDAGKGDGGGGHVREIGGLRFEVVDLR